MRTAPLPFPPCWTSRSVGGAGAWDAVRIPFFFFQFLFFFAFFVCCESNVNREYISFGCRLTHPRSQTPNATPLSLKEVPQHHHAVLATAALWLVTPRIVAVTVFVCGFDAFSRFANAFFSPALFFLRGMQHLCDCMSRREPRDLPIWY